MGGESGRSAKDRVDGEDQVVEVTVHVTCTTRNVGFDRYGFAHPRGKGEGTALRQCLHEAEEVGAHIAAIQEHKIGKYDYGHIPELNLRGYKCGYLTLCPKIKNH